MLRKFLSKLTEPSERDKRLARAHSWDLWAAAFIIGSGCGDDAFADFKLGLLSLPEEVFDRIVADPDELADLAGEMDLRTLFDFAGGGGSGNEPSGEPWQENEAELKRRHPRLWAIFGSQCKGEIRYELNLFSRSVREWVGSGEDIEAFEHPEFSGPDLTRLRAELQRQGYTLAAESKGRTVFPCAIGDAKICVTVQSREIDLELYASRPLPNARDQLTEAALQLVVSPSMVIYDPVEDHWSEL